MDIVSAARREMAPEEVYAQQMAFGADHAIGSWLRDPDLKLEPDSIKEWLRQFGEIIVDLAVRRAELANSALNAPTDSDLGSFPPSRQLSQKMGDRMGMADGGLAWALKNAILRMTEIHEALRQSLAAQVKADLEDARILDKVKNALG